MFRKLVMTFLLLSFSCFGLMSFAGGKNVVESDLPYVDGKVNDPVSKSARTAYIFTENPTLSLNLSEGQKVEIVSYCNYVLRVYEDGSDRYEEYYFGIVEEDIFKDYQEKAKEKELLLKQKLNQYGPAAVKKG